jgi:translation initiation factor IF-3
VRLALHAGSGRAVRAFPGGEFVPARESRHDGDRDIKRGSQGQSQSKRATINDAIEAPEVRLISDDGSQVGIVSRADALRAAEEKGLDLVLMAADAEPPVCRLMDYGKMVFEAKKEKNLQKKRQKQTQLKEMKFRPGTEEADYQVKLRNLTRFLNDGDKAKVTLRFRGRELLHQDLGLDLMERIRNDLAEIGVVEFEPKMEGRQMTMVIAPRSRKKH